MEDSIAQNFKFVDEASSSKYACAVCSKVCMQAQLAQCCGATYCNQCAEIAVSSASIQAENTQSDVIQSNPSASTCCKCKNNELELASDILVQDCIRKLQVECLNAGCGWMGILGDAGAHMKEPHDTEYEVYDNDFLLEGEPIEPQSSPADLPSTKPTPSPHTTTDDNSAPKDVGEQKKEQPPRTKEAVDYRTLQSASSIPQLEEQASTASSAKEQENVCLRFYSSTHDGDFADLSTSEKL